MNEYWLEPPCEDDTHMHLEMTFEEYEEWKIASAPTEDDIEEMHAIFG